jgi:integrase
VIADPKDPTGATARKVQWLWRAWQRHHNRLGSTATFHDLRHWNATELIDAGVPMPVVQHRLGHLQLSTTIDVYTHPVGASEFAAAEAISRRRGRGESPAPALPR